MRNRSLNAKANSRLSEAQQIAWRETEKDEAQSSLLTQHDPMSQVVCRLGDNSKIGATTVIINRDVPSNCTVVGDPGRIVKRAGRHTNEPLPQAHYRHAGNAVIDFVI